MTTRHNNVAGVNLGGPTAVILFVFVLLGFVIETQLTQYVQTNLGYRQPYFIFYFVHSFFSMIFPAHFLYLTFASKHSPKALWRGLMHALKTHVPPISSHVDHVTLHRPFPTGGFVRLVLLLTAGMSVPGLCWFIAVTLAPLTDTTALWNTNAFFAYIAAVKLFKLNWEIRRLSAVLLATAGAVAVVYGGSISTDRSDPPSQDPPDVSTGFKPTAALTGDLLTLVAAVVYGIYQVLYKMYASLPTDPDPIESRIEAPYEPLPEDVEEVSSVPLDQPSEAAVPEDMVYPPPFALYPNMLTAAIGICTFLILWIPIPILHVLGIRPFYLPHDWKTAAVLLGIAVSGIVFNAGFMVLLGLWGPILTSIGSLLTIVLVFLSDIAFGGAIETITIWSLLGCGSIIVAFGILAYDMIERR